MSDGSLQERLDHLLSVADPSLGHLGTDELLVELLNRVLKIVDADTAAVLLVDEGGTQLVARAASGIEEEVRQGVRVPVGSGFAGAIAATRRPIVLDQVGPNTVTNPILWEKGIRVMLGVPLLSGDDLIGVLHIGRLSHRPFHDEDVEVLSVVAERVAGAVQSHRLVVERAAADMLERSLLPPTFPKFPGLEFAARYVPQENRQVGGDWYDAFMLPSGDLWLVIGDVAGHGLGAAAIMGRVRSALRAYALEDHAPDEVLRLVNRKVHHFEPGAMVTAACAILSPASDQVQLVAAGHAPPILAVPGRPAAPVDIDVLPPLGIMTEAVRKPTRFVLPPGGVLVMYTDGLIERREESLDLGLARLSAAVVPEHPEVVCRTVMSQMIGSRAARDDVAVVVVRRVDVPS